MKTYLVTGGCGFIGVNLIPRLIEQGVRVRVLDNLSLGRREDVEPLGWTSTWAIFEIRPPWRKRAKGSMLLCISRLTRGWWNLFPIRN